MIKSVFRLIQISPNSVSKGMILKLADSKYVQVTGKKEVTRRGSVSVSYKGIDDASEIGEIKVRTYDTLEHINSELIVEVEKVDEAHGVLRTSRKGIGNLDVPMNLIPRSIQNLKPGAMLNILMDEEQFVTMTFEGYRKS